MPDRDSQARENAKTGPIWLGNIRQSLQAARSFFPYYCTVTVQALWMAHPSTLEPAVSNVPPKSNASTSPADAVTVEFTGVGHTPSRNAKIQSLSSTPVPDNLLPISMMLPLDSA